MLEELTSYGSWHHYPLTFALGIIIYFVGIIFILSKIEESKWTQ